MYMEAKIILSKNTQKSSLPGLRYKCTVYSNNISNAK